MQGARRPPGGKVTDFSRDPLTCCPSLGIKPSFPACAIRRLGTNFIRLPAVSTPSSMECFSSDRLSHMHLRNLKCDHWGVTRPGIQPGSCRTKYEDLRPFSLPFLSPTFQFPNPAPLSSFFPFPIRNHRRRSPLMVI